MKSKLVATFEKDEDGYWSVVVQLGPKESVISDGQTLPKARKRLFDAIATHHDIRVSEAEKRFELEEVIQLPEKVEKAISEFRKARAQQVEAARLLEESRKRAASSLVSIGISRRDAGDLLGVSGQRVQQLVEG